MISKILEPCLGKDIIESLKYAKENSIRYILFNGTLIDLEQKEEYRLKRSVTFLWHCLFENGGINEVS